MGYALMIFVVLLMMSIVIVTVTNYGNEKDSKISPLKAENVYAERESGKAQTDFVVVTTKVNGTALYTFPDAQTPKDLNLYLTVKNNGSAVLNPSKYSILLNNTWIWINSTSDNFTSPQTNSSVISLNLTEKPLSLLLTAENGFKIILPTAPVITQFDLQTNTSNTCYYDVDLAWNPSYGEVWPIIQYAIYYTNASDMPDKNLAEVAITTQTNYLIGNVFRTPKQGQCASETGESRIYVWVSAFDTHGNEGVPSNTCGRGVGGGTLTCG